MGRLTTTSVRTAKPGRHGDGDGLYLLVKPSGAKSWLLRVQAEGRRRDIGLGAADTVNRTGNVDDPNNGIPLLQRRSLTLTDAREKARQLRGLAKAGRDPIVERDRDRKPIPTFKAATLAAHEALKDGWAVKSAAAFLSSLEEHAFPIIGQLRVDHVEASNIRDTLEPIWLKIPVMARKVRQRIGIVLNFAKAKGWRTVEAPGRSTTVGLPKQPKGGNFASMPYADVPRFVETFSQKPPTAGRQALLFQILTASRPGEVRRASWAQIDLTRKEWRRSAEFMKNDEAHVVTLNTPAVALLHALEAERSPKPDDLLFPGRSKKPMSDMTLKKVLTDAKEPYDAHGFRSSFRDWAAEQAHHIPDPVAEAALAHLVPDQVVRAYKRTKFLEMRRELLDAWGKYVAANVNQQTNAEAGTDSGE